MVWSCCITLNLLPPSLTHPPSTLLCYPPSSLLPFLLLSQPYDSSFPLVSVEDMVQSQFLLLDHLGINKVHVCVWGGGGGARVCMALGYVQYLCVSCVESSGTCPSVYAAPCIHRQLTGRNAEHLCCHTLPRASQEVKWEGLWRSTVVCSLVCVCIGWRWRGVACNGCGIHTLPIPCCVEWLSKSGALKAHSTAVALQFIQRRILMGDSS